MRSLALTLFLGVLALAGGLTWRWLSTRAQEAARTERPVALAGGHADDREPSRGDGEDRTAVVPIPAAQAPPAPTPAGAATGVRGVVLRPDGTPAREAEVWSGTLAQAAAATRGAWPPGLSRQETGADGRFELVGLVPGSLRLTATARGFAPSDSLRLELSAGQSLEEVTLRLRVGARIRGEVYRPDGAPAAGRLLRLSQAEHGLYEEVGADGDGRFLAERLVPGAWRIDTFPDEEELAGLGHEGGMLGGFEHLSTKVVEVADGAEAFVILGLPSGAEVRVHGRVLSGGEGVGAILQWVQLGTGGSQGMVMGQADADGMYAVELGEPGAWLVSIIAMGRLHGCAELPVLVPAGREHERDLELPGGSISGRVLAADGTPLEGAGVSLRLLDGARHRSTLAMPGDVVVTNARGRYRFRVLDPGTYAVAVQGWVPESGDPAWAASVREDVVLPAGGQVEDVDFLLEPGHRIRGFVLDADGRPGAGAAVLVFDESGRCLNPIVATHAAEQGWFTTRPVAAGRHALAARFRELVSDPFLLDVSDRGIPDVELVLRPGCDLVVEWSALDVDPRAVVPFVQVTDGDGRRWGGLRDQRQPFDWRREPADPHLPRVGPLPPGTYVVVASLPDGRRGTAEVSLTASGEQRVRLVLE